MQGSDLDPRSLRPTRAWIGLWCLQPVRLYVKGVMLGFKRGLRNTYHHTSLIKIQASARDERTAVSFQRRQFERDRICTDIRRYAEVNLGTSAYVYIPTCACLDPSAVGPRSSMLSLPLYFLVHVVPYLHECGLAHIVQFFSVLFFVRRPHAVSLSLCGLHHRGAVCVGFSHIVLPPPYCSDSTGVTYSIIVHGSSI